MPLIPAAFVPTYETVDLSIFRVDIERVHSWSSYSVTLYTSPTAAHRYPHSPGPRRSSSGPGWRTPRWRGRGPLRAHRGGQPCTCRGQGSGDTQQGTGVRRYTAGDRGQEIHSRGAHTHLFWQQSSSASQYPPDWVSHLDNRCCIDIGIPVIKSFERRY